MVPDITIAPLDYGPDRQAFSSGRIVHGTSTEQLSNPG
jgi:hypothetical protein